ncbi:MULTISPECIES: hypothetical protein [Mycobacterium]|uniref:Uncharacterized protein n=1 Tax=Mycobacterium kiyosense TaxID=2871094 RepID=A0A9P3V246_9MYCO|nr:MULTISPECIES: hypothetical protein [Mycobacterium]BDB43694.1 hypothetical protein IWGMT90018_41400 [Mycobacterium kiyosense]BDE15254.1 hypothetical protein MKCMC460_41140 [Mycobacterium sp. 20KCMC460]GLB86610.1 hypothetical protein SRL2020028_58660 [Mycobacterium kiyosense]GLB93059.1 hypothetical protein SRL2020130_58760 [Mycobacterium kiyosense]GLB99207.1 hypothetical protein SRL2020226_59830 [Mycobacterium kiyosense]
MTFSMQPEFMEGLIDAQDGASATISSAFGAVTPAVLASFSVALGPIAVANMIPAMYESTGNNVMSGMMTAANHAALGAATHISQGAYVATDTPANVTEV